MEKKKKIKDPTKTKIMLMKINRGWMLKVYSFHVYLTMCSMRERKRTHGERKKNRLRLIRINKLNEIGSCELCGKELSMSTSELHHIKPVSQFPELRYDPDNMMLLCHDCHVGLHKEVQRKAYEYQSNLIKK